jgi:hypothetical protein
MMEKENYIVVLNLWRSWGIEGKMGMREEEHDDGLGRTVMNE